MSSNSLKRVVVTYDKTMTLTEVATALIHVSHQEKTRIVKRKNKRIPAYEKETTYFKMTESLFTGVNVTVTCTVDRVGSLVLHFTQQPHRLKDKHDFNDPRSYDGY